MRVSLYHFCDRRRIQRRWATYNYSALLFVWMMALSTPMYESFCIRPSPASRMARIRKTPGNDDFVRSNENRLDLIPDPFVDSFSSSDDDGDLAAQWKQRVPKASQLLRTAMTEICRDMSPQEALEFRLQTRLDLRFVPYATVAQNANSMELVDYSNSTNADFMGLEGAELRQWIEDDDRYTVVDWGGETGRIAVVFPSPPEDATERGATDDSRSVQRRAPNRLRFVLRLLWSLPRFVLYTLQIASAFYIFTIPPFRDIIERPESNAMAASTDTSCFCDVLIYSAVVGLSNYFLVILSCISASIGTLQMLELIKELQNDTKD